MEALECLMTRRSIRKYKKDLVDDATLAKILEAGQMAPTAAGKQSPVMVVVKDPEKIAKLSKMNAAVMGKDADPFYGAPMAVLVFGDSALQSNYVQDASCVMENLMLAAHALGVDSCWINRGREMFEKEDGKAMMAEWGIPATCVGVGICILGYRDCDYPEPAPRKEGWIVFD